MWQAQNDYVSTLTITRKSAGPFFESKGKHECKKFTSLRISLQIESMVRFEAEVENSKRTANGPTEKDKESSKPKRHFPVTPHPVSKKKRSDNRRKDVDLFSPDPVSIKKRSGDLFAATTNVVSLQMDSVSVYKHNLYTELIRYKTQVITHFCTLCTVWKNGRRRQCRRGRSDRQRAKV